MITDGKPFVIGQQRVVGTEQPAHGGGMVDRRVEIREVADDCGKRVFHRRTGHETTFEGRLLPRSFRQAVEHGVAQRAPGGGTELHQAVEHRAGAGRNRGARLTIQSEGLGAKKPKIQHLIADRDAAAKRLVRASPAKYAERQILDGKIALPEVRGGHPAPFLRIVGRIERHRGWSRRGRRSWALKAESDRNAFSIPASNRRSPVAGADVLRAHGALV